MGKMSEIVVNTVRRVKRTLTNPSTPKTTETYRIAQDLNIPRVELSESEVGPGAGHSAAIG